MCEFYYKMQLLEKGVTKTIVKEVEISLDEEILEKILGVPVAAIQSIEGWKPSTEFTRLATKRGELNILECQRSI